MGSLINLEGKKFGKLLVKSHIPMGSRHKWYSYWKCLCDCGKECEIRKETITNTIFPSCGCDSRKHHTVRVTHGHSPAGKRKRTYRIWTNMKQRCLNPNCKLYPRYGGRGIKCCDRWRESYFNFLSDMGECPDGMSIDRIDNNGGYEPGNCRWATPKEQARNRTNNRLITIEGETKLATDWVSEYKMGWNTINYRMRKGFTTKRDIFQPVNQGRRFAAF